MSIRYGGWSGKGETKEPTINITDILVSEDYVWRSSNANNATYMYNSYNAGKKLNISYINWGMILIKDKSIPAGEKFTLTEQTWIDGGGITSYSYFGFFTEEEFASVTPEDPKWTLLTETKAVATSIAAVNKLTKAHNLVAGEGFLCFMCVHGEEINSYTAGFQPLQILTVTFE